MIGSQAAIRIPAETLADKVQERLVVAFDGSAQRFTARSATSAFARDRHTRLQGRIEEEFPARAPLDDLSGWWTKDLHDAGKLFLFVFSRKDGVSGVELGQDASKAPHVDP